MKSAVEGEKSREEAQKEVADAVRAQLRAERALLASAGSASDCVAALDSIDKDWNALLIAAWAAVGLAAGAWLYDGFDHTQAEEALLTDAIIDALSTRAKGISETTKERLKNALEGVDGQDAAQDAISDTYDRWLTGGDDGSEARSNSIGWDLTVGAWGAGLLLAGSQAEDAGLSATRTWVSVGDDRVRDSHQEADGQTIGIADSYDVGGESLDYPGDPSGSPEETYNCRCGEDYEIS